MYYLCSSDLELATPDQMTGTYKEVDFNCNAEHLFIN